MKRALVLSGGGCKGAFEVGAIDYLIREAGVTFDLFLGTSVGALNAAFLGQARCQSELVDLTTGLKTLWLSLSGNDAIYRSSFFGVLTLLWRDALYEPSGLRSILYREIDVKRLFDPATTVQVTSVCLETGALLYADTRRPELQADFIKYILASASMPLFFPPVAINHTHWYDGGLRNITPLGSVFEEKPDEIVVITTYPVTSELAPILPKAKACGALGALLRTVEILTSEIGANDLKLADQINQLSSNANWRNPVPIRLITPAEFLPGENALDFDAAKIRENIKRGFKAAQSPRFLNNLVVDPRPSVTVVKTSLFSPPSLEVGIGR